MIFEYRIWNGDQMIEVKRLCFETKTAYVYSPHIDQIVPYPFDKVKLMPASGFFDDTEHPNRKQIYADDIVQVTNHLVENVPTYNAIVVWDKYRFALRAIDDTISRFIYPFINLDPFGFSLKIIGNVYQSPELLVK